MDCWAGERESAFGGGVPGIPAAGRVSVHTADKKYSWANPLVGETKKHTQKVFTPKNSTLAFDSTHHTRPMPMVDANTIQNERVRRSFWHHKGGRLTVVMVFWPWCLSHAQHGDYPTRACPTAICRQCGEYRRTNAAVLYSYSPCVSRFPSALLFESSRNFCHRRSEANLIGDMMQKWCAPNLKETFRNRNEETFAGRTAV